MPTSFKSISGKVGGGDQEIFTATAPNTILASALFNIFGNSGNSQLILQKADNSRVPLSALVSLSNQSQSADLATSKVFLQPGDKVLNSSTSLVYPIPLETRRLFNLEYGNNLSIALNGCRYANGVFIAYGSGVVSPVTNEQRNFLWRSADNGDTWTKALIGDETITYPIQAVAYGALGWVAGSNLGRVLRSVDNGATWTEITVLDAAFSPSACEYFNGRYFFASGNQNQIFYSDDLVTFTPVPVTSPIQNLAYDSLNDRIYGVSATAASSLQYSDNMGLTWTNVNTGLTLYGVAVSESPFRLFLATNNGLRFTTNRDGINLVNINETTSSENARKARIQLKDGRFYGPCNSSGNNSPIIYEADTLTKSFSSLFPQTNTPSPISSFSLLAIGDTSAIVLNNIGSFTQNEFTSVLSKTPFPIQTDGAGSIAVSYVEVS